MTEGTPEYDENNHKPIRPGATPEGPCPEFDDDNYEPILTWANATVTFSSLPIKRKKVVVGQRPLWTLSHAAGFISFMGQEDDEKSARMASAMFIYLWYKGVPVALAEDLALIYAWNHKKRRMT